jgi:hypothetical protein
VTEISSRDFQDTIKIFIERMGFTTIRVDELADGSRDFLSQTTNPVGGQVLSLIRASPYNRFVGEADVESLYEKALKEKAVRAAYITTSDFDRSAVEYSRERPLSLINKYQIIESMEKRGLTGDRELVELLGKYGLAEKHFLGKEHSFETRASREEVESYFKAKAAKTLLGKPKETVSRIGQRYAPVGVFKASKFKDVWTGEQYLRKTESRDYIFVNLHNLDLYYLSEKRQGNKVERQLMRDGVLRDITELPVASRAHLMDMLKHGDLPIEALDDKDLAILKNKKLISVYEGRKDTTDSMEQFKRFLEGVNEVVIIIIDDILDALSSGISETEKTRPTKDAKKKVTAQLNLPHQKGGKYDLVHYLKIREGANHDLEADSIDYPSKELTELLSTVFKADIESQGLLFIPYFRARYTKAGSDKLSKYELYVAPSFNGSFKPPQDKPDKYSGRGRKDKKQRKTRADSSNKVPHAPRIKLKDKAVVGKRPFKLIR